MLVIKKGKTTKTVAFTVKSGRATVTLPELKKGVWKVQATFAANSNFTAKNSKTYKVKVKK